MVQIISNLLFYPRIRFNSLFKKIIKRGNRLEASGCDGQKRETLLCSELA